MQNKYPLSAENVSGLHTKNEWVNLNCRMLASKVQISLFKAVIMNSEKKHVFEE